ncbi:extracellular matrix protein 2 isoform X1 [Anguilla rostrata]|uniref:extracellular matrix protein 2 isoform X1 n=1 Tax=Anguilla rostrata TaxID=7938 RepID=UPI0030D6186B
MCRTVLLSLALFAALYLTDGALQARKAQKTKSSRNPATVAADATVAVDAPAARGGVPVPGRSRGRGRGKCVVDGLSHQEGALWSPQPCSVCLCERGAVTCEPLPCSNTARRRNSSPGHRDRMSPGRSTRRAWNPSRFRPLAQALSAARRVTRAFREAEEEEESPSFIEGGGRENETMAKEGKFNRDRNELVGDGNDSEDEDEDEDDGDDDDDDDDDVDDDKDDDDDDDDEDDNDDDDDDDDDGEEALVVEGGGEDGAGSHPAAGAHSLAPPAEGRGLTESMPIGCLLSESVIACRKAGLTHMPILTDPNIRVLYLSKNKIRHVPPESLAGLPNLEWLDLSENKLTDSSLSPDLFNRLTKLTRLNLDGNSLTKIPALPPSLEELKMNDNKIVALTPQSFAGQSRLLRLELEDNRLLEGSISPAAFRPLRQLLFLKLDENKLRSVPRGLPPSLQELRLSENKLEKLQNGALNRTPKLRALDLSHNHIREDLIGPKVWKPLKKLEVLDLSHNKLLLAPPLLPPTLRLLSLHRNQIQRVPANVFGHMKPGLDALSLSHNHLRDDGVTAFSFLGLYRSLTKLYLDSNQLRSLPLGLPRFKALELLRLDNNLIRSVPESGLCDSRVGEDSPLEVLHLEHNLIDRRLIPPSAFSCLRSPDSVLLEPQAAEQQRA